MSEKSQPKSKGLFKTLYAFSFAWQLGFIIALPIFGFLFLGKWVDRIFDTHPIALVGGVILGIAITIYEVRGMLMPFINDKVDPDEEID